MTTFSLMVQAMVTVVLLIKYSLVFCDQMLHVWPDFPELLEGSNTCSFTFFATTSMLILSFLFVIVVVFVLSIGDSVKV